MHLWRPFLVDHCRRVKGFLIPKFRLSRVKAVFFSSSEGVDHDGIFYYGKKSGDPWEAVVGLEIHAQLQTIEKLFSVGVPKKNEQSSWQCSPFDIAMPGTLPILNRECVELAVKAALVLQCNVQPESSFDRKHYTYHDLPHGYQITQHYKPLAVGGQLKMYLSDGVSREFQLGIRQIHLEQDTAKTLPEAYHGSMVDYGRAGKGLIEIVTAPDLRSGKEAVMAFKKIQRLLKELAVCDGDFEAGSIRCDANVSIRRPGSNGLGIKTELKNLSPFFAVHLAVDLEIHRQIDLVENGEAVKAISLKYCYTSDAEQQLVPMRDKEGLADYRFLPDADLPPLIVDEELINRVKLSLPVTIDDKRAILRNIFKDEDRVHVLLKNPGMYEYFMQLSRALPDDHDLIYIWMMGAMQGILRQYDMNFSNCAFTVKECLLLLERMKMGRMDTPSAKLVLRKYLEMDHASSGNAAFPALLDQHSHDPPNVDDVQMLECLIEKFLHENKSALVRLKELKLRESSEWQMFYKSITGKFFREHRAAKDKGLFKERLSSNFLAEKFDELVMKHLLALSH